MKYISTYLCVIWLCASGGAGVYAASITTETFSVDMAGWGNAGSDSPWMHNTNHLRVVFPQELPIALPKSSTLAGGTNASSSAFHGDFRAVGAELIGFDFMAENALPSTLTLTLANVTSNLTAERFLSTQITQTGVWYRLAIPITSMTDGQWDDGLLTEQEFETILTNVQAVRIRVGVTPNQQITFRLDNIFLGRLPTSASLARSTSGVPLLTWSDLQPGWNHRVEASTYLPSGVWTEVGTFSATNTIHTFMDNDATNAPLRIYRIWMN